MLEVGIAEGTVQQLKFEKNPGHTIYNMCDMKHCVYIYIYIYHFIYAPKYLFFIII